MKDIFKNTVHFILSIFSPPKSIVSLSGKLTFLIVIFFPSNEYDKLFSSLKLYFPVNVEFISSLLLVTIFESTLTPPPFSKVHEVIMVVGLGLVICREILQLPIILDSLLCAHPDCKI